MTVKRIGNVFSWASILEDNTLEQAQRTASLPFLAGPLALMPDAHLGMGATIIKHTLHQILNFKGTK